ncbi:Ribosomal RNA-processing protein 7 [Pseudozyma hubeiensis]|nr:Ribosomal RNA-processing protein 7 [Pseudozyma hubeiensis]
MAKKSRTDPVAASSSRAKDAKPTSIPLSNGFVAVPLKIVKQDVTHWIYVRKHTAASSGSASSSSRKVEELPADRTLFVANLPVDATEEGVRGMFGKVGGVSMVKFRRQSVVEEEDEREERGVGEESDEDVEEEEEHHQISTSTSKKGKKKVAKTKVLQIIPLPSMDARLASGNAFLSTASSAHIVFLDPTSLQRAFDLLTTKPPKYTHSSSPTGLSHLLSTYTLSRPSLPDISAFANSVISLYNYRRAHPLPRRIGVRGVTLGPSGELLDEDGFIIVQRTPGGGKYGRAGASADAGGSVGVAKHGFKENDKKKSTGLEDFYRFQMRERKREELAGLRRRFEEDKAKVEKLKSGRRFKPY